MLTEELKIYVDTYKLLSLITKYVPGMPRLAKFTVGQRLIDNVLAMTDCIYQANSDISVRVRYLNKYLAHLGTVRTLTRLSNESKYISVKQACNLMFVLDECGKQANGWRSSAKQPPVRSGGQSESQS